MPTFFDPLLNKLVQAIITPGPADIAKVVNEFPQTVAKARADWGKFLAGSKAGLFSKNQEKAIVDWYAKLPDLWDGIKLNWQYTPQGLLKSESSQKFYRETEAWMNSLRTHPGILFPGLGIAPLLVAGVLVAVAFGVAGTFWAIGYIKEQNNISRMINETVAGNLPPEVLSAAVAKQQSSFFGDIKDLALIGAVGAVAYLFWPQLRSLFKRAS